MAELVTNRLRFIPWTLSFAEIFLNSREDAALRYGFQIPHDWPNTDFADILPTLLERWRESPDEAKWCGSIQRIQDSTLIGTIGFHGPPDDNADVEIGYGILHAYQRQGYATEITAAVTDWALSQPGVRQVKASCLPDNEPSIRVLEKCGYERDGFHDGHVWWVKRR